MGSMTVGVVLPVYRPAMERLAAYIADIRETIDPDTLLLEWDAPDPANVRTVRDMGVTVHTAESRRGKGAAITGGFNRLETDVLAFADSDGSVPPASLEALIEPVRADEADIVAGSRRHPAAENVSHASVVRRLMGDVFAWTARRIIAPPLYDYQCGAKVLTQEAWSAIVPDLQTTGYGWDTELIGIAHVRDADIREVPVAWQDQPGSTVAPVPTAAELARTLARTAWYQRRHR